MEKAHPKGEEEKTFEVKEPTVAYGLELVATARAGVSRSALVSFAKTIDHSIQALSQVLPASYSSLSKKKVYDQETSERILELMRLYAYGTDVFGSVQKFNDWLHADCIPLGHQNPFDLLDTSFGIELVYQEIGRIDHGIFS